MSKGKKPMSAEKETKEPEIKGEEEKEESANQVDEKDTEIEALKSELEELKKQNAQLKEDDLRRAADTENYKKRLRQDKESAIKYANERLITDLLTPLDNFSRAIEAAEQTEDFNAMKQGVVMVEDQMMSILKQNWGLERIDAVGKPFNPNEMEAYQAIDDPNVKEETVSSELAKGYKLNGKVIRTAKVVVSKPVEK